MYKMPQSIKQKCDYW